MARVARAGSLAEGGGSGRGRGGDGAAAAAAAAARAAGQTCPGCPTQTAAAPPATATSPRSRRFAGGWQSCRSRRYASHARPGRRLSAPPYRPAQRTAPLRPCVSLSLCLPLPCPRSAAQHCSHTPPPAIPLQRTHDEELRNLLARHDDVEVKVSSLQAITYAPPPAGLPAPCRATGPRLLRRGAPLPKIRLRPGGATGRGCCRRRGEEEREPGREVCGVCVRGGGWASGRGSGNRPVQ